MFKGVSDVGIGVSDMDRSLKFYGDLLGFTEVMFDYTGSLRGIGDVGKPETRARVVILNNQTTGPAGLGMIKLLQLLPPDKPEPCTVIDSTIWGDIGLAEVCFNTSVSAEKVFADLLNKGLKAALTPTTGSFAPYETSATFAYMRDPDNCLMEFIDWKQYETLATEAKVEGVNHVGFGVSDLETSVKFYKRLGFTELIFEKSGLSYKMATFWPVNPPKTRVAMLANYHGAWVELLQLLPPYEPTPVKEQWGHLGAMDFSIGIDNIEKAYESLQKAGVKFVSPPQIIETSSGQWKYVYLVEPDGLHISLTETSF